VIEGEVGGEWLYFKVSLEGGFEVEKMGLFIGKNIKFVI
jgi:hypothetical protein